MPATVGNDNLTGTTGADTLAGLAGNDTISGGAGNDVLIGGSGVDTALFASSFANYVIARNASGGLTTSMVGGDGYDLLVGVENLKFSDALVTPLMAGAAAEIKVNSAGAGGGARVAKLSDGGWVVIWSSGTSTAAATLYGQRYDPTGAKVGAEFAVNPARVGNYDYGNFHSISGLTDGGWVVTWVGIDASSDYGVFGQRFSSSGTASGGVFNVNTTTVSYQLESSVVGLTDGGWLCVWNSKNQDGSGDGILMRRFGAVISGFSGGNESIVNTWKTDFQTLPKVAALSNGGWVVVWQSNGQDGSLEGIYGQAYSANGNALGTEFRANTTTSNRQSQPVATGLSDGGWVVAWQSYGQEGLNGIYAQRYSAAGAAVGSEFRVNTYTTGDQQYPVLTALADGGWVVVWESDGQDGSGFGVYGQRYAADGSVLGSEFRANSTTDSAQTRPSVSALEDGGWVVSWLSSSAIAGKSGILYQRYGADGAAFSTAYSLNVTGDATSQNFVGTASADTLSGMAGNDTLNGGAGADIMLGGTGNDVFLIDQAGDSLVELAGEGTDTIISTIDYSLLANVENLTLVDGSAGMATGNSLNNVINGNANHNTLDGGAGADTMAGGIGDDVYQVDSAGDVVNEAAAAGNDLVISSTSYTLSSNVESITLTGTANLSATGNTLDNTLTGNTGINTLSGGTGNDTYVISHESTVIVEGPSAGTDVVRSTVSYRLLDNVENLVLLSSAASTGTGNALSNVITGNAQSNTLDGGAGVDTLIGGAGDDVFIVDQTLDVVRESAGEGTDEVRSSVNYSLLSNALSAIEVLTLTGQGNLLGAGNELDNTLTGNAGIDTLAGGTGNDVYVINHTADRVIESAGSGIDEVRSNVSYTISENVERLVLTGGDGIVGYGNSGDNTLVSGGGIHTLAGGLGNDTYYVNHSADVVVEFENGWTGDQVVSTVDYGLSEYVENLRLEGFTAVSGTGNALANIIEGNAVANRLLGGGGNDSIDGGLGADTLIGGTGDDQYYIDDVNDVVVESFEEGIDAVSAYVTHVLSGNVENLQLSGSNAINGGGNALANQITGNEGANSLSGGDGNDTLNGGAGIDTLVGGAGDDLYLVSESSDVISETQDAGIDTVRTLVSYRLASNIENLTITSGADSVDGIGNSLANIIVGGSGANVLFGAEGDDTLSGNAGNDVLVGGSGTDVAIFAGRMSDYSITQDYSTGGVAYKVTDLRVTSAATGVDLVVGVEHLKFTDASVQLVKTATGVLLSDLSIGIPGTSLVLQQAPSIAALSDGGSVAVWMSYVGDGDMYGVSARQFNAAGVPVGAPFVVNTTTNLNQMDPKVIGLRDGGYVVTWTTTNLQDGSGFGVVGQLFSGSGSRIGGEFIVNPTTLNTQSEPAITALDDGGFVTTWQSFSQDAAGSFGIYGQRYSSVGTRVGAEFRVNLTTAGDQKHPAIASLDNRGFVVTWNTTTDSSLWAQRYTEFGTQDGGEIRVTTKLVTTDESDVVGLSDGGFVVVYASSASICLQRFKADGTKNGVEVIANTLSATTYANRDPHVSAVPGGGFLVTWTSYKLDGDGDGIYASRFDAAGSRVGGVFRINAATGGAQLGADPVVIGDTVITAWSDTSAYNIELRRLDLDGSSESSRFDITGDSSSQTLTGSEFGESVLGLEGVDTLIGLGGNDTLDGGAGVDSMLGGFGNDIYFVDNAADVVVEANIAGTDSVFSSTSYQLSTDIENLTLTGTGNTSATGNILFNSLVGNDGDNTLDGGAGLDELRGGLGNDTYLVDRDKEYPIELSDAGNDSVIYSFSTGFPAEYILPDNIENLAFIGAVSFKGTGNGLANSIVGGAGGDTLNGLGGVDTYAGGWGDDVYYVDSDEEVIIENAQEGSDTVYAQLNYTLSDNIENLTLTGVAGVATGNGSNNLLTGNTSANTLYGGLGNDTLIATGSVGDQLVGGEGDDTYTINRSDDVIIESLDEGMDTVRSPVSYVLGEFFENLTLIEGSTAIFATGNAGANYLTGNSRANRLDGGLGGDTMAGAAGDDTYYVDDANDIIIESANMGYDTIYTRISYTLAANLEYLGFLGDGNLAGRGNEIANTISGNAGNNSLEGFAGADTLFGDLGNDTISGGADNDYLTGDDGDDQLDGGDGNDTLLGGSGSDTLVGGAGDDLYYLTDVSDSIVERSSGGIDNVYASVSYRLADDVENLTLFGSDSLDATGNSAANFITGNSGNNFLDGAGNIDTLVGGDGNDTLAGGLGDDVLTGGNGVDVAQFNGKFSAYRIGTLPTGGMVIVGPDGTDKLTGIEALKFSDATVKVGVVAATTETASDLSSLIRDFSGLTLAGQQVGRSNQQATTPDGGLVRVFESTVDMTDVYLERRNVSGQVVSGPSLVNSVTAKNQWSPSVTVLNDGGWYVVWSSNYYHPTDYRFNNVGIWGQRYDAQGGRVGSAVAIDQFAQNISGYSTYRPVITKLADGGWIVAYETWWKDGSDYGVAAQRFNASGVRVGSEFQVNLENTGGAQEQPSIYGMGDGGWIITWQNRPTNTSPSTLMFKRYDSSGVVVPVGGGFVYEIKGDATDQVFAGGIGDDTLDGGAGSDTLTGALGNDIYVVDNSGDLVTERASEGTDAVFSSVNYTLSDNVESLTLTGSADLSGTGNVAANVITGNSGNNTLNGGASLDVLTGGAGNDLYILDSNPADGIVDIVNESADGGIDTVRVQASYAAPVNVENIILTGTGNFSASGNLLANRIEGNDGSNVLSGGSGLDTLIGGKGDDTYDVGSDADVIIENANEGSDTVIVANSYALLDNFEKLTLTGTASGQLLGNAANNELRGNGAANTLDGGAGNDILYGASGDDLYIVDSTVDVAVEFSGQGVDTVRSLASYQLSDNIENLVLDGDASTIGVGNSLANRIEGNAGNNTLDGMQGADTLIGGSGNDVYVLDSAQDVVNEDTSSGSDEVRSAVDYVLGDNLENLTLTGTTAQLGTGNALANRIEGNGGANTLEGGDGIDTLIGGAGNDVYVLGADADIVIESENQGWDTVRSLASYALGSDVERLELLGEDNLNGVGNRLANVLVGNSGSNVLTGLLGDDTLIGLGGQNTMEGGEGNDRYQVDSAADTVLEAADQGQDRIVSSVSFALSAHVEEIELIGSTETIATGNSLRNLIIGSEGNNTLDGSDNADTMIGGRGNDIYVVNESGDVVSEAANEGIDGVRSNISYRLGVDLENLTLLGSDSLNGTGNDLDNRLIGNLGGNILDGGAGADTLEGSAGNDVYIVDHAGDVVIEQADEGVDEIRSGVSIALSENVENLSLTGVAALWGSGNQLNNRLAGNDAANTLDGGAGADMMSGGGGNDLYVVDNAGDFVVEASNSGRDEVRSSVDFQLSDNVENLTLLSSAAVGRGNALDNAIQGNDANNLLDGGAGSDSMTGGAGDDVYIVDAAGDRVIESASQGFDEVRSSLSYELVAELEKLVLTGTDNLSAKGNALDNVVIGNAGNNTIVGEAGADTMEGLLGDDIYGVDNLGDVIVEARNGGVDQVVSTVSFTLADNIERLSLSGDQNIDGIGNNLDNVLIGNLASNVLRGLVGNDTLDGGRGSDTLIGGSGNDVYYIDSLSDLVIEEGNAGRDRIYSSVATNLPDNFEEFILDARAGVASIEGNGENNLIIGNASSNSLSGAAGNDTLSGNGGKDVLSGGFGNDHLLAAGGNNVLTGGFGEDRFEFSGIINTENTIADLEEGEVLQISDLGEIVSFASGSSAGLKKGQIRYKIIGQDTDLFVGLGNSGESAVIHLKNFTDAALITTSGNKLGVNINSAPTGTPAVSGLMVEGSLLTASIGTLADADGIKTVLNWQWQRSIVADEWQSISGANGVSYQLNQADVGYRIRALASYTDGKNANESMGSEAGALVANVNSAPSEFLINLSGGNNLDATINVLAAASDGDGVPEQFDYRWQRGLDLNRDGSYSNNEWADISGARESSYKVGLFDAGRALRVVVSYVDLMGTRESKTSTTLMINSVADLNLSGDGDANDIIGSTGNDLVHGYGGNDRLYGWYDDDQLFGDDGDDQLEGEQGNDSLDGGIGNDLLTGGTGNDWLVGGDGNDTLKGSEGADTMDGGRGDDTYFVDDPSDVIADTGPDSDIDVVYLMFTAANIGSYQLGKGIDNASINDDSTLSSLEGNAGNNQLSGNSGQNSLVGGDGNDSLVGNAGNDTLYGGSGNDYVGAGIGDDLIIGGDGAGDDTYVGGEGVDTIKYTSAREGIFVDLSAASNQARSLGTDAGIGTDQLSGIENVIGGDFGDYLKGNAEANIFTGGRGNDTLDGGAGADRAVYSGSSTSYRISAKDGLTFVQSIGATNDWDTLSGIEKLQFSDKVLDLLPNRSPTGAVTIVGKLVQQATLTAGTTAIKDADVIKSVSYQWMRDGSVIANATGKTYTLTQSDVGATVGLSVSFIDGRGYFETMSATVAAKVVNVNDAATGSVLIVGDAKEGAQLSVSHTITDADGTSKAQHQYQWLANGKLIANATGSTLQLDQTLVGTLVSVKVSFVDDSGASESLVSAPTAKVANVNNTPTGLPTISGTVATLSTLSVDTLAITDIDGVGKFSYQWQRLSGSAWLDIAKATKTSYTLTQADSSGQFRVKVSYTDKQGTSETIYSDSAQMGTLPLTFAGTEKADTVNGMSGADTLAGAAGNDRIVGNGGADKLNGGLGNDQLDGGLGDDQIMGGLGTDSLWGGGGVDTFSYAAVTESSVSAGIDMINDFIAGDKIDLKTIDANIKTKSVDEAFSFASAQAANAVWVEIKDGNTFIYADNDGKAGAELVIQLTGQVNLTADDFVL